MAILEAKKPVFSLQISQAQTSEQGIPTAQTPISSSTISEAQVAILPPHQHVTPTLNSATMTDLTVVTVKGLRSKDLQDASKTLQAIEKTPIDRLAVARALHKGHNYPMTTTKGSEMFTNMDPAMTGGSTYGEHSIMTFQVSREEQTVPQLAETTSQAQDFSKALMMNDKWYLEKAPNTTTERAVVDMMVILEEESVSVSGYLENRPGHVKPAPFFLPELEEAA